MNKKGFELSVSMIVILVIAIMTLLLALAFITGVWDTITKQFNTWPTLEIEPTADDPLVFAPLSMSRGKKTSMSIGFYNNEAGDIPATVTPEIQCIGLSGITVEASGLSIPVGQSQTYLALVSVPKTTTSDQYSCVLTLSQTQETFILEVK